MSFEVEKQALNSMLEELFDLMTDGIITASKCKAIMCNVIDENKDEPETELEIFVGVWLNKIDKRYSREEGAKACL